MAADTGGHEAHVGGAMTGTERGGDAATLSAEQARQVAAVVDVCLERGFDVEDVDRETLEAVRAELRDQS